MLLFVGSSLAICGTVFSLNIFFDPLWYLQGNQLEGLNYMFDERLSKTNQYLKRSPQHEYNCIIFGSSRTTLLDESLLKAPYRCFNFSFSGGRIEEFIAFAKWLKTRGEIPDYLILGIDDFNFINLQTPLNIPDFIHVQTLPPSMLYSYMSLDALSMTIRLLFHDEYNPKIYNHDFIGTVVKNPPQYTPSISTKEHTARHKAVQDYLELQNLFPDATVTGYIPPISSWETASKTDEELNFFLDAVYTLSQSFDALYDFSIPSTITSNPATTYDGSHYFPFIQHKITSVLNGDSKKFGLQVQSFSRIEYKRLYHLRIEQFLAAIQKKTDHTPQQVRNE